MQKGGNMRIGQGYDVHRFCENRELVLGGVSVPSEKGLLGHSDADVLTHAIMDSLLGAAALRDIGYHFPDKNPAYEGISSLLLLKKVGTLLSEHGYRVGNIDATIIMEQPKVSKYLPDMVRQISGVLSVPESKINIKATTEEGLGFTGKMEGVSAMAVALLEEI